MTYRFFSASTLRHDKLVSAQKDKQLKVPQLSDTRWACRYLAVNMYRSRYGCLVEALEEVIENSSDRTEAAGILAQIQKFSFLILLTTFDSILGLTKPLSDALQAKNLNLSAALELVDSIIQLLKQRRSEDYFKYSIWKDSQEMADKAGVEVALPTAGRRTRLPSRFRDSHVLESTGGREHILYESYKAVYYQAIDKVLMELDHRFGEPRPILQSIAALSPKNSSFLESKSLLPLAEAYNLDADTLRNQLEVARVILKQKNVETVEASLKVLGESHGAFPEAMRL